MSSATKKLINNYMKQKPNPLDLLNNSDTSSDIIFKTMKTISKANDLNIEQPG